MLNLSNICNTARVYTMVVGTHFTQQGFNMIALIEWSIIVYLSIILRIHLERELPLYDIVKMVHHFLLRTSIV